MQGWSVDTKAHNLPMFLLMEEGVVAKKCFSFCVNPLFSHSNFIPCPTKPQELAPVCADFSQHVTHGS